MPLLCRRLVLPIEPWRSSGIVQCGVPLGKMDRASCTRVEEENKISRWLSKINMDLFPTYELFPHAIDRSPPVPIKRTIPGKRSL
jgi:hypothetical protein